MRLGEALRLNLQDFDPLNKALTIYQTKNQTERVIPLAPSLAARVQAYIERFPGEPDTPLFLSPRGPRPHSLGVGPVDRTFKILLIKAGLPQRVGRTGPRVHDLRHSFAVHRLENWYHAGENLEAKLPLLATYLGHTCLRDTYYYLRITTSFFPEIARRLNAFTGDVIPQGGQS
jgi:integrase